MTFTPLRTYAIRFLAVVLLFGILSAGMDGVFERGHSGDLQKVAVLICDEQPDSGDPERFLPQALASPAFKILPDAPHGIATVRTIQAIYSPPPRPPAFA